MVQPGATPEPVAIVNHPDLPLYDFGPFHPLRPERIELGLDLLHELGAWHAGDETCAAVPASESLLESIHSAAYIEAVRAAGEAHTDRRDLARFGLTSTDNPPFSRMHYASSLVAGGAAQAVRGVMRREVDHVFHPAGGLHHAHRGRASGFCIYNDPALAAAVAETEFRARVAYLDFDCHHGDGVQWLFYDDPSVLTVSFHESGRFLFPGTGDVHERGEGAGLGYAVNVPFAPFTGDASWLAAVRALAPPLVKKFAPDVLLTVHGCDTHVWDPLTHLALSTRALAAQASLAHELAHEYCGGRWVAFGSGGYEWRRVVPRSWAILWSEMSGRSLPERLPAGWLARWARAGAEPLPSRFLDDPGTAGTEGQLEAEIANRATLDAVLQAAGID